MTGLTRGISIIALLASVTVLASSGMAVLIRDARAAGPTRAVAYRARVGQICASYTPTFKHIESEIETATKTTKTRDLNEWVATIDQARKFGVPLFRYWSSPALVDRFWLGGLVIFDNG